MHIVGMPRGPRTAHAMLANGQALGRFSDRPNFERLNLKANPPPTQDVILWRVDPGRRGFDPLAEDIRAVLLEVQPLAWPHSLRRSFRHDVDGICRD